ncbi:hypothetical protein J2X01_004424 [Arthrobacter ginsengisoli]|uniref:Uncharacterized protein n=1 Tax=Arthrobacter ginsengisoli TaxID=1356565 RepID=A0ABU1UIU2_9MICC|nr:hypothetical protein [Arthrobacter ginsengisoli]
MAQGGIALEALGYLIDIEKNGGANLNNRKQMNFKPGLRVILGDMKVKPFSDVEGWIDRADEAYMGAKHPDRPEPDFLVQINTLRENLLVLRFWIGTVSRMASSRAPIATPQFWRSSLGAINKPFHRGVGP